MLNEVINASLNVTLTGLPFFLASLWLTYVYMGVANAKTQDLVTKLSRW